MVASGSASRSPGIPPGPAWLSPRAARGVERILYGLIGGVLLLVALAAFGFAVIGWSIGAPAFVVLGAAIGILAVLLGYRMALASILGRRMYWWAGQRAYDERDSER